jgi:Right handed beta helix region/Bacterial TSP3 repeat
MLSLRRAVLASVLAVAVLGPASTASARKRDRDHDGLTNRYELRRSHTNPRRKDTDRDRLKDGAEVRRYHTKPRKKDTDRDRLKDGAEVRRYHTNPRKKDTDRDGLGDGAEVRRYHTNPRKKDTDGDGLSDGEEVRRGLNPRKPNGRRLQTPPPPAWTCDMAVSSAAALRSAVQSSPGKTICVQGSIGNVNLQNMRPSAQTQIAPDAGGGALGTVDLTRAANITIIGISLRSAVITGDASRPAQNIQLRSCHIGGTPASRVEVFAAVDIRAYSQNVLVSGCEIGWLSQGNGDNGYGVRAVNGNGGPISDVTIELSRITHVTADAIQLAEASNFTLDRSELSYISSPPGGIDTHADCIQIMSLAGDGARFTNNYIHHTGYYDENHNPSSGFPAGQWLWSSGGGGLVENNLIINNRNYAPAISGDISNIVLRRNTILRNGLAFGSSSDDLQWSGGGGTGKVADRNIFGGVGGASGVSFTGNVFIDQSGRGPTDLGRRAVSFDANWNPTNLPAGFAGAGYRKPAGVGW